LRLMSKSFISISSNKIYLDVRTNIKSKNKLYNCID
jgi:hypothetical protein